MILQVIFQLCLYIPGERANSFRDGDRIDVLTNSLRSPKRPIPLDFYIDGVFCSPDNNSDYRTNIGEYLTGDILKQTSINAKIGSEALCNLQCTKVYNEDQKRTIIQLIDQKYRIFYMVDNLPVTTTLIDSNTNLSLTVPGFEIGFIGDNGEHYLNNYVELTISLAPFKNNATQIVGFEATSVISKAENDCDPKTTISVEKLTNVTFSYSIKFETSRTDWENRWDKLLTINYSPKIHWFSISNTLLLVILQSAIVVIVLLRTVKSDFKRYSQFIDGDDDPLEETGWRLVHGEVFRPPPQVMKFTSLIGSGFQLLISSAIIVVLAALGFLSPSSQGAMITTMAVVFSIAAPFGGFLSSKLFRTIGTKEWRSNLVKSGLYFIFPSILFYVLCLLIFRKNRSTAAISFGTFFEFLVLVIVLDMVLHSIGSIAGLRSKPFELPVHVSQFSRQIPRQPKFLNSLTTSIIGGLLSFASIIVQVHFIFEALWTNMSYYYLFGLLIVCFFAMVLTSCEVSLVFTYLKLCYEDYNWWWSSFRIPASCGAVFFIYCLYYLVFKYQPIGSSSYIVYISMSAILSFGLALINGAAGFLSSFVFVRKIFSILKME